MANKIGNQYFNVAPHRIALAVLCGIVAFSLSSCGNSSAKNTEPYSDKSTSPQSSATSSQTHPANDLINPLDAYNLTVDEKNIVQSASNKLVSECMHKKGFNLRDDYTGFFKYTDEDNKIDLSPQLWGLMDADSAAKRGYKVDNNSHGKEIPMDDSNRDYFHALINDDDGCDKEGTSFYGDAWASKENQAQEANFYKEAEDEALADSRITSIVSS
ncbi:MAG: hypothetical protein LBI63_00025 [Candidatus Ancillula sp.]|jgi:hypothetical protein|nr:hypothetical protein [Candidatus Ancillula sp.]